MNKLKQSYISLKEAAEISGYAPDYIGQLIRQGKLPGKQVYKTVAWMTTEKALRDYLKKGTYQNAELGFLSGLKMKYRRFRNNLSFEGELKKVFKAFFYLSIVLLVIIVLIVFYIFSISLEKRLQNRAVKNIEINYQNNDTKLDTDLPAVP